MNCCKIVVRTVRLPGNHINPKSIDCLWLVALCFWKRRRFLRKTAFWYSFSLNSQIDIFRSESNKARSANIFQIFLLLILGIWTCSIELGHQKDRKKEMACCLHLCSESVILKVVSQYNYRQMREAKLLFSSFPSDSTRAADNHNQQDLDYCHGQESV